MSTSTPRQGVGPFVPVDREARRRRSVDSLPSLVHLSHPFVITPPVPFPPRPPRSPKRTRLADITEEGSPSITGSTAASPNPALGQLTSLRDAVQAFALRLQAIPPPEWSPEGSRTSSSPASTLERLRRVKSMSSVEDQDEMERRRTASSGTFGSGLDQVGCPVVESSDVSAGEAGLPPGHSNNPTHLAGPVLIPANGHSPISPLALTGAPLPEVSDATRRAPPLQSGQDMGEPPIPPTLHVTRPSTSDSASELQPFAAVVDMMERGASRGRSPGPRLGTDEVTLHSSRARGSSGEGRAQTPRRGMMSPKGLIGQSASSSASDIS